MSYISVEQSLLDSFSKLAVKHSKNDGQSKNTSSNASLRPMTRELKKNMREDALKQHVFEIASVNQTNNLLNQLINASNTNEFLRVMNMHSYLFDKSLSTADNFFKHQKNLIHSVIKIIKTNNKLYDNLPGLINIVAKVTDFLGETEQVQAKENLRFIVDDYFTIFESIPNLLQLRPSKESDAFSVFFTSFNKFEKAVSSLNVKDPIFNNLKIILKEFLKKILDKIYEVNNSWTGSEWNTDISEYLIDNARYRILCYFIWEFQEWSKIATYDPKNWCEKIVFEVAKEHILEIISLEDDLEDGWDFNTLSTIEFIGYELLGYEYSIDEEIIQYNEENDTWNLSVDPEYEAEDGEIIEEPSVWQKKRVNIILKYVTEGLDFETKMVLKFYKLDNFNEVFYKMRDVRYEIEDEEE